MHVLTGELSTFSALTTGAFINDCTPFMTFNTIRQLQLLCFSFFVGSDYSSINEEDASSENDYSSIDEETKHSIRSKHNIVMHILIIYLSLSLSSNIIYCYILLILCIVMYPYLYHTYSPTRMHTRRTGRPIQML